MNLIRVIPAKGAHVLGRLHYIASHKGQDGPARTLALISLVLDAGVPCVQVSPKTARTGSVTRSPTAVKLCRQAGASCIINDRVDIALAVGADGAHVGPEDLTVGVARRLLGERPYPRRLGADSRRRPQSSGRRGQLPRRRALLPDVHKGRATPTPSAPPGWRPLPQPWFCPSLRSGASRSTASLSCSRPALMG